MIIKSKTYTSASSDVGALIDYLWQAEKVMRDKEGRVVSLTKNLRGERGTWKRQFLNLEKRRKYTYNNRHIRFYQEILSFSPKNQDDLTPEIITDLLDYFVSIRTDKPVLTCGIIHMDTKHIHCHVILSGTDRFGNSIRKSKAEYRAIQSAVERHQMEKYPFLSESYIGYETLEKSKVKKHVKNNEYRMNERKGSKSLKEVVREKVESIFIVSSSLEAFETGLTKNGIKVYYRNNQLHGVYFGNRKWRLTRTLGIEFEKLLVPNKRNERLERIKEMRKKQQERDKKRSKDR